MSPRSPDAQSTQHDDSSKRGRLGPLLTRRESLQTVGDEVVRLKLSGVLVGGARPSRSTSRPAANRSLLHSSADAVDALGDRFADRGLQSDSVPRHVMSGATAEQLEAAFSCSLEIPVDLVSAASELELDVGSRSMRKKRRKNRGRNSSAPIWDGDLVTFYLSEVHRVRMLSPARERALALKVREGAAAREELIETDRLGLVIAGVERRNLEAVCRQGSAAKDEMVMANLPLVAHIAKRFVGQGLTFLDLVQEGSIGLIHAVEHFDYTRGCRLSTYSNWWIRQAIQRGIADKGRVIRLPVHMYEAVSRVRRIEKQIEAETGGDASATAIAERAGLDCEGVGDCQRLYEDVASLDEHLLQGAGMTVESDEPWSDRLTLVEQMRDPAAIDGFSHACRSARHTAIERALGILSEREQRVIRLRFGLEDQRCRTLEEVGAEFGVTRERARQIEKKALTRLAEGWGATVLADFKFLT